MKVRDEALGLFAVSFGLFTVLGLISFETWCVPITNACSPTFYQCACQLRPPAWVWVVSEAAFIATLGSGAAWLFASIYEGLRCKDNPN